MPGFKVKVSFTTKEHEEKANSKVVWCAPKGDIKLLSLEGTVPDILIK